MSEETRLLMLEAEMRRLQGRGVMLECALQPATAFVIASQLQLALRHPENTGRSAETADQVVRMLMAMMAKHSPFAASLMALGWAESADREMRDADGGKGGAL